MTNEEKQRIGELESQLAYRITPAMTLEKKLSTLRDAYFCATNAGYADAMAGRLMGGCEDSRTERWELDCKHRYEVSALIELLEKQKAEGDAL